MQKRACQGLHHLVVQRAAVLGVRMADDGGAELCNRGQVQGTFNVARRARDEDFFGVGVHRVDKSTEPTGGWLASHIGRQQQALDHFAVFQMRINNLVDVVGV